MNNNDLISEIEARIPLLEVSPNWEIQALLSLLQRSVAALRSAESAREGALREVLALPRRDVVLEETDNNPRNFGAKPICYMKELPGGHYILDGEVSALLPAQPKAEPVKPEGGTPFDPTGPFNAVWDDAFLPYSKQQLAWVFFQKGADAALQSRGKGG